MTREICILTISTVTFNYIATNEKDVDSSVSEFIDKYEEQDEFCKVSKRYEKKRQQSDQIGKDLEKYS